MGFTEQELIELNEGVRAAREVASWATSLQALPKAITAALNSAEAAAKADALRQEQEKKIEVLAEAIVLGDRNVREKTAKIEQLSKEYNDKAASYERKLKEAGRLATEAQAALDSVKETLDTQLRQNDSVLKEQLVKHQTELGNKVLQLNQEYDLRVKVWEDKLALAKKQYEAFLAKLQG